MLHLILADCELERVPPEISHHRIIKWWARRRGRKPTELILDSSLFFPAIRKLENGSRRGRPDIVHRCLLVALDSPLNKEGLLRVYVHTRNDELITIEPHTRLPRTFNRFVGLIESLFLKGFTERKLLKMRKATLEEVVNTIRPSKTICFSMRGKPKTWKEIYGGVHPTHRICLIIGGFPEGEFISDVDHLCDEIVCVDPEPLASSSIVARAIFAYEEEVGLQMKRFARSGFEGIPQNDSR